MRFDTFVTFSCIGGIIASVICTALIYELRSGSEQKSLSLIFNHILLLILSFYITLIADSAFMQNFGIRFQYLTGVTFSYLLIKVLTSEYDANLHFWQTLLFLFITLVLIGLVLFMDYSADKILFYTAMALNIVLFVIQIVLFVQKRKNTTIAASTRNATLLFILFCIPQAVIFEHLWIPGIDLFSTFLPLVLALCEIAITLFALNNRFVPLEDLRYKALVSAIEEPLFITDIHSNVIMANEKACSFFPECNAVLENKKSVPLPSLLLPIITDYQNGVQHKDVHYVYVNWNVFEPSVKSVTHQNHNYGYILRLHDVTEHHQSFLKLSASKKNLERDILNIQASIESMRSKAVSGAIQFLGEKDETSSEHMRRSSNYTYILARQMRADGLYQNILTDEYIDYLVQITPLHDIGKFFVTAEILKKPDQLSPQEYEAVKSHVLMGAQMVDRLVLNEADDLYYKIAHDVTLYHHEWWDGSGYLSGLKGKAIPLCARIVSVATVFDLVSTDRPYKAASTFEDAFETVVALCGTQFDPDVIQSFKNAKDEFYSAYMQMVKRC